MPDPVLLLVVDERWPLDADAAQTARELELATGASVTTLRVPTDRSMYALAPPGAGMVVVVVERGTSPMKPPSDWTRSVCWHATAGCTPAWRDGVEVKADSIAAFVAPPGSVAGIALGEALLPFALGGACVVVGICVVVGLILVVRRRS